MNSSLPSSLISRSLKAGLFSIFLLLGSIATQAQTTNWTGGSGTNWNTLGNWDNGVPTPTLNAVISSTATNQPILSTTATAKSVAITTGASLSIAATGSLSIDGSTGNGVANSGRLTNAGNLLIGSMSAVGGAGISNSGSGTITNGAGGTIQIDRTGSHAIATAGVLNNASIISIGSLTSVGGQGISSSGRVNNMLGGQIIINRTGTGVGGDGIFNGGTGTFINSSTLTMATLLLWLRMTFTT